MVLFCCHETTKSNRSKAIQGSKGCISSDNTILHSITERSKGRNSRQELRATLAIIYDVRSNRRTHSQPKCTAGSIQDAACYLSQRLIHTQLAFINSSGPPNIKPRYGPICNVLGFPTLMKKTILKCHINRPNRSRPFLI